jgi:hypothetical protein
LTWLGRSTGFVGSSADGVLQLQTVCQGLHSVQNLKSTCRQYLVC